MANATIPTNSLRVAVVQVTASLEPQANREQLVRTAPEGTDLIVYPEAFARDFGEPGSDVSPFAESTAGPFAQAVAETADRRRTTIVAGMFETSGDPGKPFNTLVMRGAAVADYRKIHLYDSFGFKESDRLTRGEIEPCVVSVGDFRVGLMTCYDLRFPELSRALIDAGADVLVAPAAWVAGPRKADHWRTLVRARAIENTCFVVAAGQSGPGYTGRSLVVDPWGDVLAEAGEQDEVITATLNREVLDQARATNPSLSNRRMS